MGLFFLGQVAAMWFLYLDEIGHIGAYDAARPNHGSPIFGLGGVALQAKPQSWYRRPPGGTASK